MSAYILRKPNGEYFEDIPPNASGRAYFTWDLSKAKSFPDIIEAHVQAGMLREEFGTYVDVLPDTRRDLIKAMYGAYDLGYKQGLDDAGGPEAVRCVSIWKALKDS